MALFKRKLIQGLRYHTSVALQERVRISLEISQASLASFESRKLVLDELAGLLKIGEFPPEFVEGDEALG
ncbi:MAG: hypothetical protein M3N45_01040 [Actinomycetota bacterium]|nr:hypothetical protein [Actinomycetota bacterium]